MVTRAAMDRSARTTGTIVIVAGSIVVGGALCGFSVYSPVLDVLYGLAGIILGVVMRSFTVPRSVMKGLKEWQFYERRDLVADRIGVYEITDINTDTTLMDLRQVWPAHLRGTRRPGVLPWDYRPATRADYKRPTILFERFARDAQGRRQFAVKAVDSRAAIEAMPAPGEPWMLGHVMVESVTAIPEVPTLVERLLWWRPRRFNVKVSFTARQVPHE